MSYNRYRLSRRLGCTSLLCRKYQLYLAWPKKSHPDGSACIGYTSDLLGLYYILAVLDIDLVPLSPPLPIAVAVAVCDAAADRMRLERTESILKPALKVTGIFQWMSSTDEGSTSDISASGSSASDEGAVRSFAKEHCSEGESQGDARLQSQAAYLGRAVQGLLAFFRPQSPNASLRRVKAYVSSLLVEHGFPVPSQLQMAPLKSLPGSMRSILDLSAFTADLTHVLETLAGRSLFRHELFGALRATGSFPYGHLDTLIDILANSGLAVREPSVRLIGGTAFCSRCGSTTALKQLSCAACQRDDCWVCTECSKMGEARSCIELIAAEGMSPKEDAQRQRWQDAPTLTFEYELTRPQSDASLALRDFVGGDGEECLVWAVCGAGKTEVVFSAVDAALRQGLRVLFAIPRKDVVLELEGRVREAFRWAKIAVLYGGSKETYSQAQLVLATTHQVLRHYRAYDLAVVDEADAFPFLGSSMLAYALQRSRKPRSRLIYMTATPDKSLLAKVDSAKVSVITISARHHGKPLPEPELMSAKLPEPGHGWAKGSFPKEVIELVRDIAAVKGDPLFIFAPTIDAVVKYGQLFSKVFPALSVASCHSADSDRAVKREAFQAGRLNVLVSTSIMERGITVAGCGVLVLNADFVLIYDERALVQMAGRAGRSTARPDGRVVFVGREINRTMKAALLHISRMNSEARRRGYLS